MQNFPELPSRLPILYPFKDVYETINLAQDQLQVKWPDKPKKPSPPDRAGQSAEYAEYARKLAQWETDYEAYKEQRAAAQAHNGKVQNLISEFIQVASGLNSIPEQYREKVFAHAYSTGHSSGHYEVYNQLCELIEIFK